LFSWLFVHLPSTFFMLDNTIKERHQFSVTLVGIVVQQHGRKTFVLIRHYQQTLVFNYVTLITVHSVLCCSVCTVTLSQREFIDLLTISSLPCCQITTWLFMSSSLACDFWP
jgi:hypothetical protein